jgi:hypothetical protein
MSVADEVLVVQDLWTCGFYELPATTGIDDRAPLLAVLNGL